MHQQKQQKNSRTQTQQERDPSKIGYLLKKPQLTPLNSRSSSGSTSYVSQEMFRPSKKIKIPDIYYEQILEPKKNHKYPPAITEKDSTLEGSINIKKGSTLCEYSRHQGKEISQNSREQQNLCQFHRSQLINQLKQDLSDSKTFNNKSKINKNRCCCETQPTPTNFSLDSKQIMIFNSNSSASQISKYSNQKLPMKLRPIKTNFYQKSELFGRIPNKLLPPVNRKLMQRSFISKNQEQQIVQKLSKPKCTHSCTKTNCQCFNRSRIYNSLSSANKQLTKFYIEDNQTKKLRIDIDRFNINQEDYPEAGNKNLQKSYDKTVNQKKTERRKKNMLSFERFKTEPFDNQKLISSNLDNHYQNQVEPQKLNHQQNIQKSEKNCYEDQSFIKGIINPELLMKKEIVTVSKRDLPRKQDIENSTKPKQVQIKIQTEDISILRDQQNLNKPQKSIINQDQCQIQQKLKDHQRLNKRMSIFSNPSIKPMDKIGYTFATRENLQKKQFIQKKFSQIPTLGLKLKGQRFLTFKTQTQYWINYDIHKRIFTDLMQPKQEVLTQKPNIGLASSVVNEVITIQHTKNFKKSAAANSPNASQVSNLSKMQKSTSVPITTQILPQKTKQPSSDQANILAKSRNCISSLSAECHANTFNRSLKSLGSSAVKKCFRIPKQAQYVDFVKNYQPINPQIKILTLAQQQRFRVIPLGSKFFFGQTIGQSIKHGLGVQISSQQIFEGEYFQGNRKRGFLKKHDGVYEGPIQVENAKVYEGQ